MRKRRRVRRPLKAIFCTALTSLVVACSTSTPFESPIATLKPAALNSPLLPVVDVIPTPSAINRVTITGVLLENLDTPRPVAGAILYLAHIVPDSTGTPILAGLDKVSSPHTQTDAVGRFVFANVPAETYAIILDRFYDTVMLNDPRTGADMLLKPEAGQVLDLGDLVYPSLLSENPTP